MGRKQAKETVFEMNGKEKNEGIADAEAWNKMLVTVFQQNHEALVLIDYHGNVRLANNTACAIFGYDSEEFKNMRINSLLRSDKKPGFLVNIPDLLHIKERNIQAVKKDGHCFPVNIRMSSISSKHSVYALLFVSATESPLIMAKTLQRRNAEIVKLKELNSSMRNHAERALRERTQILQETVDSLAEIQKQLKQSLQKEMEANEKCSKFAYLISHEYRTPLTSILTSIQLIERYSADGAPLNQNQKQHLDKVKEQVKQLVSVSEELLHLNTTLHSHHKLAISEVELSSLLSDIGQSWQFASSGEKEIPIRIIAPDRITIETNIEILRQIVNNLVGNAVKYSDGRGEVLIVCEEDEAACAISVKDQGRGIPQDELNKLSNGFYRATNADGVNGNGLGLFIVRQFLEHLNGQLELDSKLDFGTCATIRLPKKYEEKSIVD